MPDSEPKPPITKALKSKLGDQAGAVEDHLSDFHDWLTRKGKNPARRKPLSEAVSKNYHDRIDQIYRFILDRVQQPGMTVLTREHADQFVEWLDRNKIRKQNGDEYSETSKRKFTNALQKYFEWQHDRNAIEEPWEPRVIFTDGDHESADKLSFEERWLIRDAAMDYGSLPAYHETDPDERDRVNGLVAQRLGKPKAEVTNRDWTRADTSTKIGSLIAVALETGMIPVEIAEARLSWFDENRDIIKIPNEYAAKDRPTTELPVTEDTGECVSQWIQERRHYEKYDGTNRLWLNEHGNPYNSKNLCYLLRQLCDKVGINHEGRNIVWYSLRHNLGQLIEETEDLSEARDQLRHTHISTTKEFYAESAIESRRKTLEQVNETAKKTAATPDYNPYADDSDRELVDLTTEIEDKDTSDSSSYAHVNAAIDDTKEGRNKLAQKILSEEL
jgi:site-specific recombinase XerD